MGNGHSQQITPQQQGNQQQGPQGAVQQSGSNKNGKGGQSNQDLAKNIPPKLNINGTILAGGPLNAATITAVNEAAKKTPSQWRRYVAYENVVKVGGSLAWRCNNPGNLRDASTKIGTVTGAVGKFAAFATLAEGRAAQRALYLNKYGSMTVTAAINKLTPPSENDTAGYLKELEKAGVNLEGDVASQIDLLMTAVEAAEGLIVGTEVPRALDSTAGAGGSPGGVK